MKYVILKIIRLYKKYISKSLNSNCRFYPTCSIYGMQALTEWGACSGSLLTIMRILRCNPLSCGGFHPVVKSRSRRKWLI